MRWEDGLLSKAWLNSSITFFHKIVDKAFWLLSVVSALPPVLEFVNEKHEMYESTIDSSYPFLNYFLPIPDWLVVMSYVIAAPCWLIVSVFAANKVKNFLG